MKRKSEVLEKFKLFVNYVTSSSGKKVKILHSNNGGKYCSKAFVDYLKENGIVHQTTVPYNPAQNGVAECMNRTLLETTHSMMSHSKMPSELWDEAVSTATYVRNRSPTTSLKGITPFECPYNQKSDVSNLRVFGCIAFAHIPEHMRKKLEEISRKCVFVGYPEGTKGYKLFDLSTKSFIRNRDVIFDEKKLNKFNSKHSSKPSSDFYYPASVADEKDADDQVAVEHVIPVIVRENRNQPVGETHEDTFMQKCSKFESSERNKTSSQIR